MSRSPDVPPMSLCCVSFFSVFVAFCLFLLLIVFVLSFAKACGTHCGFATGAPMFAVPTAFRLLVLCRHCVR